MYKKWYRKENDGYVKKEDAHQWIKTRLWGDITQKTLDTQRTHEINNNDLMQNTGIIYHIESVLEMQIMCLITLYLVEVNSQGQN